MKRIKMSSSFREPRVVVVGNGWSILQKKLGPEINGFDEVIRINEFVLPGYEEFTGLKTTTWAHSAESKLHRKPSLVPRVVVCNADDMQSFTSRRMPAIAREHKMVKNLSTGLAVVCNLISQGVRPHIVGFDAYNKDWPKNYWSEAKVPDDCPHSFDEESELLVKLADANLIEILE